MYHKMIIGWCLLLAAIAGVGQTPAITGTVLDDYGHPLTGVSVSVKGRKAVSFTNADGKFHIDAAAGSVLVFEHPLYDVREWKVQTGAKPLLVLAARPLQEKHGRDVPSGDTIYLSAMKPERLDVLYGQEDANRFLGSMATTRLLGTTPAPSYLYALPGRLAGLSVQQVSGFHTPLTASLTSRDIFVGDIPNNTNGAGLSDNTEFNIQLRGHGGSLGQNPIAIIDGVQREFYELDPGNIESVSVLKDALSNILLGQNSSRGALIVTTQRPQQGPPRVAFTAETGVQRPLGLPTPLPAYQYAYLLNEALLNDGKSPAYTAADFNAYRNHTDPIGHPDVNWYNTILKNDRLLTRYNLNVAGGSGVARYLVTLNYMNQQGMFVTSPANSYNTNADIKRYTLNSKIDIDVNKYFTLGLQLFGRLQDGNQPGVGIGTILNGLLTTPNNAYPVLNPNGSFGGNTNYTQNLLSQVTGSGYQTDHTRDIMVNLDLSYRFDRWVKGLWLKAKGNVSVSESGLIIRNKQAPVFQQVIRGAGDTAYNQYGQVINQVNAFTGTSWGRYRFVQLSTGWDQHFGDHHVSTMLLFDQKNILLNYDIPSALTNYAAKGSYDYQGKYFAELAGNYSGYDRYAPGHQYGWFYAGGLGWNMAREGFLSGQAWLNKLKLRATYGRTGNANVDNYGYFIWRQHYQGIAGTYGIGSNYPNGGGLAEQGTNGNQFLANVNATWEKADKLDLGLDISVLDNRLQLTADYYHERYFDVMQQRGSAVALMGLQYPAENIGINLFEGAELNLTYQDHVGDLNYFFTGNASLQQSRVIFMDEQYQKYEWNRHTGHPVGQRFGLIADGLFQTAADAAAAATLTGFTPQAGDVKYKDLNHDGVIDQFDAAPIGRQRPVIWYGLTVGASFKGIEASVLMQGAMQREEYVNNSYMDAGFIGQNNGYSQAYQQALARWIPEAATTATYPRLTSGYNGYNFSPAFLSTSFFLRNGDYWRIKNVALAYNLPYNWVRKIKLRGVKIFANAQNLWTHAAYKGVDPEVSLPSYPIQKVINTGITVKL